MYLPIISDLIGWGKSYTEKRQEAKIKKAESAAQRLQSADDKLAEWEKIQAENGRHSWRDEYWTVILSIPCILVFFPDMVPHIKSGFAALEDMPEFYQYWLGVAILTSFGVRIAKR